SPARASTRSTWWFRRAWAREKCRFRPLPEACKLKSACCSPCEPRSFRPHSAAAAAAATAVDQASAAAGPEEGVVVDPVVDRPAAAAGPAVAAAAVADRAAGPAVAAAAVAEPALHSVITPTSPGCGLRRVGRRSTPV